MFINLDGQQSTYMNDFEIQQKQMRIDLKDILVLFQKIQQCINISYVSIVIFCSVDVDSLCSLKIFTKLLKSQSAHFKVYPVTKYSQLFTQMQSAKAYERVKLFMFINCGGILDLSQCELLQRQEAEIFLFDVHKPINHKNIESKIIKVIDDGCSQFQICPTSEQIQKYQKLNQYDLENSFEDDEIFHEKSKLKNQEKIVIKEKLRRHKELIQKKISNYYAKNFFSYPTSYSAYRLVRDIHRQNNDYLWYAIVGMTSMYIDQKITRQMFDTLSQLYQSDVLKMNKQDIKKERGVLIIRKGFQFTLMDHWSLYQSMLHSHYLTIKLNLCEDKGIKLLNEFIHNLGISLCQAKQAYKYMSYESQKKLQNFIIPIAEKIGLLEVTYMSFMKYVDNFSSFMASDFCYILISELESMPAQNIAHQNLSQHRIKYFWKAYDLFQVGEKQLIARVTSYKVMIKILMKQARNILERDHLISTNSISIANIKSDIQDRRIFQHPSTLLRMAYILMGILREKKKARISRPMIVNWIDLKREICLVVGVMMEGKNSIGSKFDKIAENLQIEVDHDNFMANIILIKKDHLSEFIKELTRI